MNWNIFVIESGGEYYYSTRTGGNHFSTPENASLFRSEKAAGAMIRKTIRELDGLGYESLMENIARWKGARVVKLEVAA
jgi:hypothetical protein